MKPRFCKWCNDPLTEPPSYQHQRADECDACFESAEDDRTFVRENAADFDSEARF